MQITPFYSGRMAYDVTADDGTKYVFVPQEFVNKGFVQDGEQNYDPEFLKPGAFANAASVTLPINANFTDAARSLYSNPNQGFLWKAEDFAPLNKDDFSFSSYQISNTAPAIQGLTSFGGAPVYATTTRPGYDVTYIKDESGSFNSFKAGESLLGKAFGGWVDDFLSATGIQNLANQTNDFFQTDEGKALKFAAMIASLGSSAFGEAGAQAAAEDVTAQQVTDEIASQQAAEQAAAQAATQAASPAAEQIAAEQAAAQMSAEQFAAEQAAAQAAQEEAARIAAENAAYDQAMQDLAKDYVSPQFATAAAAQGLTFKQGLDAVRAGLLINSLTGDPLGLSDVGAGGGPTFSQTGFQQVAVPTEWKSPEYSYTPVQNVSFEDLFPGVSLQGTQWQNLPQSQTFNELFAAGQQQTPMGAPVNINQIVGSILGQTATS